MAFGPKPKPKTLPRTTEGCVNVLTEAAFNSTLTPSKAKDDR